ncbi:MAG: hypothetical protein DGJ47_000615 [Rickettsiaceae bacterium]
MIENFRVVTAPDPVLQKKAESIKLVDKSIKLLMDKMLQTMYDNNGIGLAANQVAILKRVIVIDLMDSESEYKNLFPLKMANPVIINSSEACSEETEGCLSLPQQSIIVERPEEITVQYLDYNNKTQVLKADGLLSRAIQHEIDHLDGKLLINYLSHLKKTIALKKLTKIKRAAK